MFLDRGRKLEYLERTNTVTGRTCKPPTERTQLRLEPGTLLLLGNGANHHTTVQPFQYGLKNIDGNTVMGIHYWDISSNST